MNWSRNSSQFIPGRSELNKWFFKKWADQILAHGLLTGVWFMFDFCRDCVPVARKKILDKIGSEGTRHLIIFKKSTFIKLSPRSACGTDNMPHSWKYLNNTWKMVTLTKSLVFLRSFFSRLLEFAICDLKINGSL